MNRFFMPIAISFALLAASAPAWADTAQPPIDTISYPLAPAPSAYPVKIENCIVLRTHEHVHVGFSFRNIELDPITAVKVSVDLYDPFHNLLTTLDSTINGTYTPNAEIDVPVLETPGDKMPAFRAYDDFPGASNAVCYISSARYADGDVWNASARPDFEAAMADYHADARAAARKAVAKDLSDQRALGYRMAAVEPVPFDIPDGWKTATPGMYVDVHRPMTGLHLLAFTSLTGAGARGALKPSDIATVQTMDGVQVIAQHATTICGDRPAQFLEIRGTTKAGPQTVEAIKVRKGGIAYVSSYTRSIDAAPNASAEKALGDLCF